MAVLDRPIVGWSCGTPSPYVEDKCWSFIPRSRPLRSTEKNKIPFSTCFGTPQPPLGIPSMIASGLAAHPGHVYVYRHHHVHAPADRPRRSRLHPRTWLLPPASFVAPPGSCKILPFFQQQSACLSSPIFAFSRQAPLSLTRPRQHSRPSTLLLPLSACCHRKGRAFFREERQIMCRSPLPSFSLSTHLLQVLFAYSQVACDAP